MFTATTESMSTSYTAGEDDAQVKELFNIAAEVARDNGYDMVAFKCDNFGWDNRPVLGVTEIDIMADDPTRVFAPNTCDYSQEWSLEDGVVYITQYHHDSPTGETWELDFFPSVY